MDLLKDILEERQTRKTGDMILMCCRFVEVKLVVFGHLMGRMELRRDLEQKNDSLLFYFSFSSSCRFHSKREMVQDEMCFNFAKSLLTTFSLKYTANCLLVVDQQVAEILSGRLFGCVIHLPVAVRFGLGIGEEAVTFKVVGIDVGCAGLVKFSCSQVSSVLLVLIRFSDIVFSACGGVSSWCTCFVSGPWLEF
ncbi:hypothetical protein L2E82_46024 [Cichorium intybus]|uniref:Uncharacterized protein n=1 Tax=Cichorium intybus TaxID=13427 RepID=A0ACB8YSV6_CICIN|nr:hypothetical protein L2E82_46024 [Cichorium intybus]